MIYLEPNLVVQTTLPILLHVFDHHPIVWPAIHSHSVVNEACLTTEQRLVQEAGTRAHQAYTYLDRTSDPTVGW